MNARTATITKIAGTKIVIVQYWRIQARTGWLCCSIRSAGLRQRPHLRIAYPDQQRQPASALGHRVELPDYERAAAVGLHDLDLDGGRAGCGRSGGWA